MKIFWIIILFPTLLLAQEKSISLFSGIQQWETPEIDMNIQGTSIGIRSDYMVMDYDPQFLSFGGGLFLTQYKSEMEVLGQTYSGNSTAGNLFINASFYKGTPELKLGAGLSYVLTTNSSLEGYLVADLIKLQTKINPYMGLTVDFQGMISSSKNKLISSYGGAVNLGLIVFFK